MKESESSTQRITNRDFTDQPLPARRFENILFSGCIFSDTALRGIHFADTCFENCNLSLMRPEGSAFNNVQFRGCKLTGADFSCSRRTLFAVNFENCLMDYAAFMKMPLKKTRFSGCSLRESNFTEAVCKEADFSDCDLDRAVFFHTNLEHANLLTAANLSIDPEFNRLKGARIALFALPGLLTKYNLEIE